MNTQSTDPDHYKSKSVECIEIIKNHTYCLGNTVKYLYRWADKDDVRSNLGKAIVYLGWSQQYDAHTMVNRSLTRVLLDAYYYALLEDEEPDWYISRAYKLLSESVTNAYEGKGWNLQPVIEVLEDKLRHL